MNTLRSGKGASLAETGNKARTEVPKLHQPANAPNGKKRKAQEVLPEQGRKNNQPPSTPSATSNTSTKREPERESTPGRIGPVKERQSPTTPVIKPFKGPPGKKVRKTRHEKDEEYTQFIRDNEGHIFHDIYVCFDKGPNGSPTYDRAGFQLDYEKVAQWVKPKPYNKSSIMNGMNRAVDKAQRDSKRMAEIFFEKGEAPEDGQYANSQNYWKDRVSKDLGVPWHRIGVEHFEEWEKRGFKKARKGEYETFSEEERKRMSRMMEGASLRK